MDEQIITIAEFSTQPLEKKGNKEIKQSLLGVLFPLVIPVCILLYMFTEEIGFKELDKSTQIIFWVALIVCAVFGYLHSKKVSIEEKEVTQASYNVVKQSLIITDSRIYGTDKVSNFSYPYKDIIKAYSTQIVGNLPILVIKLTDERKLEFEHTHNISTVISCINDLKFQTEQQNITVESESTLDAVQTETVFPNETVNEDKITCEFYDVLITSASGNLSQIKTIRQITLCNLDVAKKCFLNLPYTIAEHKEINDALKIKETLESSGMTVELVKKY